MRSKMTCTLSAGAFLVLSTLVSAQECQVGEPVLPDNLFPQVKLTTSHGDIVIELDRRRAPITVNNFLRYVVRGAYKDTLFHRVIADFVVQGGGHRSDYSAIDNFGAVYNESGNGLVNVQRSVAMARHDDPHTASSQFFFNLSDNDSLNPSRRNWGYTVFGNVIEGWEAVEAIGAVATGFSSQLNTTDVPVASIILKEAVVLPPAF